MNKILFSVVILLVFMFSSNGFAREACTSDSECPSNKVCDTDQGSCYLKQGEPAGSVMDCADFLGLGLAYDARVGGTVCWPSGCGPKDDYCDSTRDNCDCEPACCKIIPEDECDFSGATCDGDQVIRCSDIDYDGGKDKYVEEDCGSKGMTCESGRCYNVELNECEDPGYVCEGNTLYGCSYRDGYLRLSYVDECDSDEEVCDEDAGNCRDIRIKCPYDCCSGYSRYRHKDCSNSNYECQSNKCVPDRPPCPDDYVCCINDRYDAKTCDTGFRCEGNTCVKVKKLCPTNFECCKSSDTEFYSKPCSKNDECRGYKCIPICTDECDFSGLECYDGDVYECSTVENCKKLTLRLDCGSDKTCSDGSCTKICIKYSYQACHNGDVYFFDSCHKAHQIYKKCNDGQQCIGERCVDTCIIGYKCMDDQNRAYQNTDCTWGISSYCRYGCENGFCKKKIECSFFQILSGDCKAHEETQIQNVAIPEPVFDRKKDIDEIPIIFVHGHALAKREQGESIEELTHLIAQFKSDFQQFRWSYVPPVEELRFWCEDEREGKKEMLIQTSYYYTPKMKVDSTKSISYYSDQLKKVVDTITDCSNTKVNIVAHSMGGVVSREYIRKYGGGKVNKIITVGTPNHGVYGASVLLAVIDKHGFSRNESTELIAGSSFMKRLNKDETPYGPDFYTIAGIGGQGPTSPSCGPENREGEEDGFICAKSVKLEGAKNLEVSGIGNIHSDLANPTTEVGMDVYKILISILSEEEINSNLITGRAVTAQSATESETCFLWWCW